MGKKKDTGQPLANQSTILSFFSKGLPESPAPTNVLSPSAHASAAKTPSIHEGGDDMKAGSQDADRLVTPECKRKKAASLQASYVLLKCHPLCLSHGNTIYKDPDHFRA